MAHLTPHLMTEHDDERICTNLGWHTYRELEAILFDGIVSEEEEDEVSDCEEPCKETHKRAQPSSEPVWERPPFQPKKGATRCEYTFKLKEVILIPFYSFVENGRTQSPTNPASRRDDALHNTNQV
jgi:hypothetical protein